MKNFKQLIVLLFLLGLSLSSFGDEPLFKVNTTIDELPQQIIDLDESILDQSAERPYEIVVVLANDILQEDDYGHTHGLKIIGATKLENGIRLRVSYSTDLYTEKISDENEEGLTPQHFMDENIGKFMADNIEAGKFYYWKAEVGWHRLSDVYSTNIFNASTQQILFHKLIDPIQDQKDVQNISAGYGRKDGAMAGGSAGIQKTFEYGKFRLQPSAEIGTFRSTLKDSSYNDATIALESSYIIRPDYRISVNLEGQAKKHAFGTQYSYSVNANLETRKWIAGAGVYNYKGDIDNHTRYNLNPTGKINPIFMVYGSYKFGNSKKTGKNILKSKDVMESGPR